LKWKYLGYDARIPSAAGSFHQAGDEIGKDGGENDVAPALDAAQVENVGNFAELGRNRDGAAEQPRGWGG